MRSPSSNTMTSTLIGTVLGAVTLSLSTKALALLVAALAGFAMIMSSTVAYYVLVASIPVQVDFLGGITVTKLIVPAVLGVVILNALLHRGPWPIVVRGPAVLFASMFILASGVSVSVAQGLEHFPGEAARIPVFGSLFFLTVAFIRTPTDFRRLLWVVAVSGTLEALITAAQVRYGFVLPGDWRQNLGQPGERGVDGTLSALLEGKIRAEGTTAHPILLASYFLMTIPCSVCLFITEASRSKRLLLAGMVILMSYAWYYTFARSSMIGFAIMTVVAASFYSKAARTLICVGVGLLLMGFLSYQVILDSFSAGVDAFERQRWFEGADVNSASESWQFRIESIIGGWNLFLANPWFGVGAGQSIWHYLPYLPSWATSTSHPSTIHNIFLEVGSELGIFALGPFVGLWILGFVGIKRALHVSETRPYAVLMLGLLLGQMSFVMITPMVREIWLTIPMAISLGYMNRTFRA